MSSNYHQSVIKIVADEKKKKLKCNESLERDNMLKDYKLTKPAITRALKSSNNLTAFSPLSVNSKEPNKRLKTMEAAASKQNRKSKEVLDSTIAIGKRKEESCGPALSLQDVFSDSANAFGRHRKTSRLSEIGQGKWSQLQKKEMNKLPKHNRTGGRKKLPSEELKTKKLQLHVSEQEFLKIRELYQLSGKKSLSDFIRALVTSEKKKKMMLDQKELIRHLDTLGTEIGRIGNNINQIAKYANIQNISGKVDSNTMAKFNTQMEYYLKEQRSLIKAYRALVRNKE